MAKRQVTHNVIDALMVRDKGAIDNGRLVDGEVRTVASRTYPDNGPVVIKRLPARYWGCDNCSTFGFGWAQIEAHFESTGHRVYTELKGTDN